MKFERRQLLLNYIFISCLIVLVLNDHVFKWEFSNWFTGKLSDFVGMLILPFLVTFFNPKHVKFNLFLAAILFMFWKSSLSTSAIDFYNRYAFIKTSRVVDYTDYMALAMLPLVYYIIKKIKNEPDAFQIKTKLNSTFVLIPTLFILISETPGSKYYLTHTDSNFRCHNCDVKVNMTQDEILDKLEIFNIKIDTSHFLPQHDRHRFLEDSLRYFKIREFIIDDDTLRNAKLSLKNSKQGKTIIRLNGFDYDKDISNAKMKRKLQRYFRKSVKSYFKKM